MFYCCIVTQRVTSRHVGEVQAGKLQIGHRARPGRHHWNPVSGATGIELISKQNIIKKTMRKVEHATLQDIKCMRKEVDKEIQELVEITTKDIESMKKWSDNHSYNADAD